MKKQLSLALAGAMAVSLAACGGSSSSSSAAASTASAAASGASGETIKVGLIGPKTGSVAQYGLAVINGANLYFNEINAKGGINGKMIEVLEEDEAGDATQAVNVYDKLVGEGIVGLIGDVTTTPTEAVVIESQNYGTPIVTASATAEAVTYDAETDSVYANVFRACFTDPFQGVKMADYAYNKMEAKTAAMLTQTGNDYSEGLAANFQAEFEALGGKVVDAENYSAGDVDFNAQLANIKNQNPDVIFVPNYYEDVGKIVTQAREAGITAAILGGDGWSGIATYASAEDLEGTRYCSGYATGSNAEWEAAYKAAYGEDFPNMFAPLGYDAAMTLCMGIQAAEEAGLEAGTEEYQAAVIAGIESATVAGVTGSFTFDERHNPIKETAIMTVSEGVEKLVEMY